MPESPNQQERPTLPSLQDMFPDVRFESLRLQSTERTQDPFATRDITRPLFETVPNRGGQHHQPPSGPSQTLVTRNTCLSPDPSRASHRLEPYPLTRNPSAGSVDSQRIAGNAFADHLPPRHSSALPVQTPVGAHAGSLRAHASHPALASLDLPTYVLSPDECPPDDDRRHGCGICHRRFNRPSSLAIHMNSHTGAQPFECPFPGCTRRFSVNSNMRRHYRNHREGAGAPPQMPQYPPTYYRTPEPPHPYHQMQSSPSTSSYSSFSDSDDRSDVAVAGAFPDEHHMHRLPQQGRTRSQSNDFPPAGAHDRERSSSASRPRSCTVPGCDCNQAPMALRPAFQQGSSVSSLSPRHR
ncbi:hypothetical protein L226DRAFT_312279 [Lentinus tigrinus ALCF2SS1-7]|uniref:uncharacterized protein n=1 Tax=Lentinus tigrinus ALCF2SS1-7 TaxID=1328758 RepID=UPI001166112D|nr:hypothetical protein L226DRAFT_312279 [Lentinus tigrinus ALCF2SS1-7]